jgi:hypothetical protein
MKLFLIFIAAFLCVGALDVSVEVGWIYHDVDIFNDQTLIDPENYQYIAGLNFDSNLEDTLIVDPFGENNTFLNGAPNRGQPEHILPGFTSDAIVLRWGGEMLTYKLCNESNCLLFSFSSESSTSYQEQCVSDCQESGNGVGGGGQGENGNTNIAQCTNNCKKSDKTLNDALSTANRFLVTKRFTPLSQLRNQVKPGVTPTWLYYLGSLQGGFVLPHESPILQNTIFEQLFYLPDIQGELRGVGAWTNTIDSMGYLLLSTFGPLTEGPYLNRSFFSTKFSCSGNEECDVVSCDQYGCTAFAELEVIDYTTGAVLFPFYNELSYGLARDGRFTRFKVNTDGIAYFTWLVSQLPTPETFCQHLVERCTGGNTLSYGHNVTECVATLNDVENLFHPYAFQAAGRLCWYAHLNLAISEPNTHCKHMELPGVDPVHTKCPIDLRYIRRYTDSEHIRDYIERGMPQEFPKHVRI